MSSSSEDALLVHNMVWFHAALLVQYGHKITFHQSTDSCPLSECTAGHRGDLQGFHQSN